MITGGMGDKGSMRAWGWLEPAWFLRSKRRKRREGTKEVRKAELDREPEEPKRANRTFPKPEEPKRARPTRQCEMEVGPPPTSRISPNTYQHICAHDTQPGFLVGAHAQKYYGRSRGWSWVVGWGVIPLPTGVYDGY